MALPTSPILMPPSRTVEILSPLAESQRRDIERLTALVLRWIDNQYVDGSPDQNCSSTIRRSSSAKPTA